MARILKEDAQRMLANVPDDHVFWCYDGRTFRSMAELGEAFNAMSEDAFAHHANKETSDFSIWVRDVIKDEKLARDLAKSTSRSDAAKYVARRMVFLGSKLT
ncbi:MAG: hypothetical protein ABIH46_06390 [Chloroflexota bacterium]